MALFDDSRLVQVAAKELALTDVRLPERQTKLTQQGLSISSLIWHGEGTPYVVFHGGFENAHIWDLVALLSKRPVIALDLPGCGKSDRVSEGTYWPQDVTNGIVDFLRQTLDKPAAFMGLSYGGLVALSVAQLAFDLCERLTMLDVLPSVHPKQSARVLKMLSSEQPLLDRDAVVTRWKKLHPPRSKTYLSALIESLYTFAPFGVMNADRYIERWKPAPTDVAQLWNVIADHSFPVSLLVGEKSNVVEKEDIDLLNDKRPRCPVFTIPRCGHHIPLHAPDQVALHIAGT